MSRGALLALVLAGAVTLGAVVYVVTSPEVGGGMDSKRIADLQKVAQSHPALRAFVASMPANWRVVSASRSHAEQAEIYSWGRTQQNPYAPASPGKPFGPVATNAANACSSPHGVRSDGLSYACDIRPGNATAAEYAQLRARAEAAGLVSGASFLVGGAPDYPHIEVSGWRAVPCSAPSLVS